MVFSSVIFLLYFLPFFLLIYYLCPNKLKNYVLLLGSILFYSWGAPKFIFVILGTTFLDFFLVKLMYRQEKRFYRRLFLILSISMNVGVLAYFKYCNFFIDNINQVLSLMHLRPIGLINVLLPIGISFYTFESLTYVIDVYRNEHGPLHNFLHYQTYIILFPKLIAGPIIRYKDIADQITDRFSTFTYTDALRGFHRFVIGLSKKIILANSLAFYVDKIYDANPSTIGCYMAWIGSLCYTLQIYFDFSGYSDIAIGLGQMLGFKFPENFNNPYTSCSITEFWKRWHITLGTWMKNYLYIPLGGNRVNSKLRLYFNLWLVFLLSGLWHGASWTFVLWGAYHGTFLVLERLGYGRFLEKTGKFPSMLLTFLTVNFGLVIFRSPNVSYSVHFIRQMFSLRASSFNFTYNHAELYTFLTLSLLFTFFTVLKPLQKIQDAVYLKSVTNGTAFVYTVTSLAFLMICIAFVTANDFNPFIYFRF